VTVRAPCSPLEQPVSETVTIRGKNPDEKDFFYSLDRVIAGLLTALEQGRIEEAVDVYMRCRDDIGYQVIARAQGNPEAFKQVANLFYRARDYARAAFCCEQLEEHTKAAALYERCDDYAAAAQMYAAGGDKLKAAEMFDKSGAFVDAAKLFSAVGEPVRAAACLEKAQRHFDAAREYLAAGRREKALELLQLVDVDSADKKEANRLIKEIMAQTLQRAPTQSVPAVVDIGGGPLPAPGQVVTVMEGFDFMKRLPLFEELSLPELKSVYHLCEIKTFAPGSVLIADGQPAPALFIVLEGQLQVRAGSGEVIATLAVGAHAGEMSLIDDGPATASVTASLPTRTLRLDRRGFKDVLAAQDGLALRVTRVMLRVLVARLRETTARLGRP
jgi:tetratricopeptide (TPR) repeat protein